MRRIKPTIIVFATVFALGIVAFVFSDKIFNRNVPPPRPYVAATVSPTPKPTSSVKPSATSLPQADNLDIPFTSQAPHKIWGLPYDELCEEASVLMAVSYLNGVTSLSPDYADQKLLEIKAWEEQRFGYYKDTTAQETATILKEFYGIAKVKLIYNPTVQDIKTAINQRKTVIVPAAGRMLANPYFRSPGPIYHMLVIKGYTPDGHFITNDPGTRHGENFIYTTENLMNAIHDWNGGDVDNGQKVILVVG